MSAFRAGHLRKAPVAAVMVIDGGIGGMRSALDLTTDNPQLIRAIHSYSVSHSSAAAVVDLVSHLFSCSPTSQYGGSP